MTQPTRHGDALHLTAGQLARKVIAAVGEADLFEQFVRSLERLLAAVTGERQRHGDVLASGQRRNQVERLEHEPDLVAPVRVEALALHRGDVGVAHANRAGRRRQDPTETRQQGGLAATRRPEEDDEFARLRLEREPVEGPDRVAVVDELDNEIGDRQWSDGHAPAPENAWDGSDRNTLRIPTAPAASAITTARTAAAPRRPRRHTYRERERRGEEHLDDGREGNRGECDENRLEREAAEQRRVRRTDRLQHGEVALAIERRQVHHRTDDDRSHDPQQRSHEVDRRDRPLERHETSWRPPRRPSSPWHRARWRRHRRPRAPQLITSVVRKTRSCASGRVMKTTGIPASSVVFADSPDDRELDAADGDHLPDLEPGRSSTTTSPVAVAARPCLVGGLPSPSGS